MQEAAASTPLAASLRFGRFELQPRERRLLVDGQAATIGARAFDLLVTLAARPGRLVTKSELLDLVWPGLVVEESNLHTQMSTLRKVLGGEIIATVPGRGYRFTAGAEAASGEPGATRTSEAEPSNDAAPGTSVPQGTSAGPVSTHAAPAPAADALNGLPAVGGRLIGRDQDLPRLEQALREPGCLTLIGAGGVGKTRLALAAAQRWRGRRVWVDLAPLTEGVQVAGALARAVGLTVADTDAGPQLARALGGDNVLLVLDNAEHLVDASAALASLLLQAVPALRLLVTTQLALGLAGERVLHLEPLLIEAGSTTPAAGDGAMALLVDRITAADHRLRIEPDAAPVLRDICARLDGLPLALEMAAARVPMLGLKGVRDELAQRFALLTKGHRQAAPRHRTLHAALDWSFNLLGADEQRLFAALGVFAGGFTLDLCVALKTRAGRAGSTARWEVIDGLAALVDRSLVAVGPEDPPRYRLLETMRAYALERLDASDEADAVRLHHAQVLLDTMPDRNDDLAQVARVVAEMDNIREAYVWTRQHHLDLAVRLTTRAAIVTTFTPWRAESYQWLLALEPLVEAAGSTGLDLDVRARWWTEFARCAVSGLYGRAPELARKARALARIHDQPMLLFSATVALARSLQEMTPELEEACAEVAALMEAHPEWPPRMRLIGTGALANVANRRGDTEALLVLRLRELALAHEAGNPRAVDTVETNVGFTLTALHRHDEALVHYHAVTARLQGQKDANLAWAHSGLLEALLELGRIEDARAALPAAAAASAAIDMPLHTVAMAGIAFERGRHQAAANLIGYARNAFAVRGMQPGSFAEDIDALEAKLGALFDPERLAALITAGRSLSDAQAFELACGE